MSTEFPIGTIIPYACDIVTTSTEWIALQSQGWEYCNGGEVNRTTYSELFLLIGESWGEGDGSVTFNLPDLRGIFLRGYDSTGMLDPDSSTRYSKYLGGNTGNAVGTYQSTATKKPNSSFAFSYPGTHTHSVTNLPTAKIKSFLAGTGNDVPLWTSGEVTGAGGDHTHSITGGGDNESRPPNANVNYLIKARSVPSYIEVTTVDTGNTLIDSVPVSGNNSCVWDLIIYSDGEANKRKSKLTTLWNASSVNYNVSTLVPDIGTVSGITLSAVLSSSSVYFVATSATDGWNIKATKTLL